MSNPTRRAFICGTNSAFGTGYPKLASARDGIDRYLISCICVGIEVASGELYTPNGLQGLESGILRMNPLNPRSNLFRLHPSGALQRALSLLPATKVVAEDGTVIPPVEFDHFWGPVYSAPVHGWLICRPCHQDLTNDPHLAWYHRLRTRFRRYQAAASAYTTAFGHRTQARMHFGKSRHGPSHAKQSAAWLAPREDHTGPRMVKPAWLLSGHQSKAPEVHADSRPRGLFLRWPSRGLRIDRAGQA